MGEGGGGGGGGWHSAGGRERGKQEREWGREEVGGGWGVA